ncbi:MAG: CoA-binding protein [Promethearchaeota archaeon]
MVEDQNYFEELTSLFYPKHIAFIGASETSTFGSMMYLSAFKDSRWNDSFYPVNPKHSKIMDWKCYPSVLDISHSVDTAYISVKTHLIPKIVRECVKKKIKWVIIFASGFSETGDLEGKRLEQELKEIIRGSKTRIIGPNCLGPYNAEIGMAFIFASQRGIPGPVSFMSQSGGHLSQLLDIGFKRDIRFRYGVSFGNQIDLNCIDFLKYFRQDSKTKIVASYLESFGSGNGHDFFIELNKTTKLKPVIIWKGGHTNDGMNAAFSHTGAISSDLRLWNAMVKQTGATMVKHNEEFWNAIKTFELLFPNNLPKRRNVGIVTPGGGSSVNMTDLCAYHQLNVPELTSESQEKLSKILPVENVNIKNPVDLGASGFVLNIFLECIEIVVNDSNIDIIFIPLWPHHLYSHVFKRMIKIQKKASKPFAFCLPSIADSFELAQRFKQVKRELHKNRILYFLSFQDAANSFSLLCDYVDFLKSHKID